jgi:hypothetical protein
MATTTPPTIKKLSLKKLAEFNTVWHEETGMVFKSQKEIIVVGKLVNKQIVPLSESDITTCEKYKFKYEVTEPVEEEEEEEEVEEEAPPAEEEAEEEGGEEEVEEVSEEEQPEPQPVTPVKEEVKVVIPEVTKQEVVKELIVPSRVSKEVDEFTKTLGDLDRIWKTTTECNNGKIQSLEIELEKTKKEYVDLQDLYEKMKQKFDGIKQLFSL